MRRRDKAQSASLVRRRVIAGMAHDAPTGRMAINRMLGWETARDYMASWVWNDEAALMLRLKHRDLAAFVPKVHGIAINELLRLAELACCPARRDRSQVTRADRARPSLKFNGKDACRAVASCTVNLVALSARNYFEALWYSNYYCVGLVAVSQGGDARQ
jgi:hypothetical protein